MKARILPVEEVFAEVKENKEELEDVQFLEPPIGVILYAPQLTAITARKIVMDGEIATYIWQPRKGRNGRPAINASSGLFVIQLLIILKS